MNTQLFGLEIDSQRLHAALSRFWHWWLTELIGMIPSRWRQKIQTTPDHLILRPAGTGFDVIRESASSEEFIRHIDPTIDPDTDSAIETLQSLQGKGCKPILKLPVNQALCKIIELPSTVRDNLRQVLGFEMDRYTPFKPDQIYYDFHIVETDGTGKRMTVKLCVVPRKRIDEVIRRLEEFQFRPEAIMVEGIDRINLLPVERRKRRTRFGFSINKLLIILILLMIAGLIITPLWGMRQVVIRLNQGVTSAEQAVSGVEALRAERDTLLQDIQFISQKSQSNPSLLVILNELTRIIPDNTWLMNLQYRNNSVIIQGESPAASQLIEIIEASDYFTNTAFRASVTSNPRSGLEGFQIVTDVVPRNINDS